MPGKLWLVPLSDVEALANNADPNSKCKIEVWHDTSSDVDDCELYLKLSTGWSDGFETDPEEDPDS